MEDRSNYHLGISHTTLCPLIPDTFIFLGGKYSGAGLFVLSRQAEERPGMFTVSDETVGGNLTFCLCRQHLSSTERRCPILRGQTAYSYLFFSVLTPQSSPVSGKLWKLALAHLSGIFHNSLLCSHFSLFWILCIKCSFLPSLKTAIEKKMMKYILRQTAQ